MGLDAGDELTDAHTQRRFGQYLQHGVLALPGGPEFTVDVAFQSQQALLEFAPS